MTSLPVEAAAWITAAAVAAWLLQQPWWTLIAAPITVLAVAALISADT